VACGIANTPQQNLAYARWAKCSSTGTLERVDLDGRIIFRYTTAGDRKRSSMPRRSRPYGAASARARGPSSSGRPVIDQRGRLLMAALGFAGCSMPSYDRALHALRSWLVTWAGIGHVTVGMARQGYDLQLTRYDEKGWRATFYTAGMEHSPTSATGTGWERTPWHAVQRAACEALRQVRMHE
jgi:hypothetical protein